jgi:hypothetical protein
MENNSPVTKEAPPVYWVVVHVVSILLPAILWTGYVLWLVNANSNEDPRLKLPLVMAIGALFWMVISCLVVGLAYALAGGFEKRTTSLSPTRFYLFMLATGFYPGLLVGAGWLFIRSLLAHLLGLKDPAAMGRLLRVRDLI